MQYHNSVDKKPNKIKYSINKDIRRCSAEFPLIGRRFIVRKCRYSVIFPLRTIHFPFFAKKRARDNLIELLLGASRTPADRTRFFHIAYERSREF